MCNRDSLKMKNRLTKGQEILVATHNKGKASEFKQLFLDYNIKTTFSYELGINEPEENGKSFKENSIIKAKSALKAGLTVISDDSGLCVTALNGEPGIYSARWAKKYGGWMGAMEKIYKKLIDKDVADFSAKYYCCLTMAWQDGNIYSYSGQINGTIIWPPQGVYGFGYDPFFIPLNSKITFGEMEQVEKMKMDHRYKAFKKIIKNHL